jgi:ABC-type transport system involved in multi-copper enzyme maturation permease subunit
VTPWTERLLAVLDNPLIVKDGVSRMRSWRAPVVLTVYLGVLGSFGYVTFVTSAYMAGPRAGSAQIGSSVFIWLALIQLSLLSLFAPALASGAISGERERQTFDVLLVSRVTASGIVLGKLVTSVAFMMLMILAALPLFAAVFLFGGVDFEQFLVTQVVTVTTAVSIGAVSLFVSALFRRTLSSTVVAYGVAFFGMVGTFVAGYLFTLAILVRTVAAAAGRGVPTEVHPLLFTNPFYAIGVVLDRPDGAPMPLARLLQLILPLGGPPTSAGPPVEPWQAVVVAQVAVVVLSVFGAIQLVQSRRAPAPRRPPAGSMEPIEAGSEA